MRQGQHIPGGYYLIARKLFDSAIWSDNPHILKLFIYLIGEARHEKKPKRYHGFSIKRGELVTSLNQIAQHNKYEENGVTKTWSRSRVHRMLKHLEKYGYVELIPDTRGTHLSICNYSYYQDPKIYRPNDCETIAKRLRNDCETTAGTNKKGNKGKNDKKEERKEISAFPQKAGEKAGSSERFYLTKKKKKLKGWELDAFEEFWKAFHWYKDKANAADAWLQIPGLTPELVVNHIVPAAARYCAGRSELIENNHTPKWAQGWLSSRRWEDEKFEDKQDGLDNFLRRHGKT